METYPIGVSELPATATRLDVGAGRRLCAQGARRQEFGVVVSGRARVLRDAAVVAHLEAGDHFGEFTLLRGLPSPVTIVADEASTIAVMTGAEFRGTIGSDPRILGLLECSLDARIRDWIATPDAALVGHLAIA